MCCVLSRRYAGASWCCQLRAGKKSQTGDSVKTEGDESPLSTKMEKIPRKNWDLRSAVEWNCLLDASGVAENCGGVFQRGEADGCDTSGGGLERFDDGPGKLELRRLWAADPDPVGEYSEYWAYKRSQQSVGCVDRPKQPLWLHSQPVPVPTKRLWDTWEEHLKANYCLLIFAVRITHLRGCGGRKWADTRL